MARMNDLLKKYDVRPPGRAVRDEPSAEPVEPAAAPEWTAPPEDSEIPDFPEMTGDLSGERFQIKSGAPAAPDGPDDSVRTGAFHRMSNEPSSAEPEDDGFYGGTPEPYRPSWKRNEAAGPMPGLFGRSRVGGSVQLEEDWGSRAASAEPGPGQRLRDLKDRLPPLWGIDLGLILISLVGMIGILVNLSVVLRTLAGFICSVIGVGINIMLLLVLGLVFLFFLRRPPRSRW